MDKIILNGFPAPGGMPPMGGPGGPDMHIELPNIDFENLTLDWEQYADKWELSEDGSYYGLKFVYYCTNVCSPGHQYMNIYVPVAYLNEDCTINNNGVHNGYTAKTAPIVLHNGCGGWKSSIPSGANTSFLKEGFVHVSVGARSRGLADGKGKAPSACVDQKAAIRMLRLHQDKIPGFMDRIVSIGGSGGGQMSSIIGATGNMAKYYPYLFEIGAAGIEKSNDGTYTSTIRDNIFASQCYCPIADIDNADLAYAWMRYDDPNPNVVEMMLGSKTLSPFQFALQNDLAQAFCSYVMKMGFRNEENELLTFELNADGSYNPRSGSYYTRILRNISASLNAWLKYNTRADGSLVFSLMRGPVAVKSCSFLSADDYIASLPNADKWLVKNSDSSYTVTDLTGFIINTGLPRGKDVPGFDTFWYIAENNAFGTAEEDSVHFSASVAAVLEANYDFYKAIDGFSDCDVDKYIADGKREDLKSQTYLMNATQIMLACVRGEEKSDIALHWRTRNGTADEHTSYTVAYNLCMAAHMAGGDVDYSLVWNAGHGDPDGDGTGTFAQWVHKISQ